MQIKNNRVAIFILAILLVVIGVFFIFHKKIIAHFIPVVEQVGDIYLEIKDDTTYVNSKLVVQNRSFLKIEIDSIKYKISLFEKIRIQSEKFLGLSLPKYGSDSIDFAFKIPHVAILKDIKTERTKKDSAGYSVIVSLHYTTIFGSSEIPINLSGKLKIPQPPDIKIVELKWTKVRRKSLLANVKIQITNFNNLALSVKDLNYSMNIVERGNIKGKYEKSIHIKPLGTTTITFPIEIKTDHIGKTILDILLNKDQYKYTFQLNAKMESAEPNKITFNLDLFQKGKIELKK